MQRLVAHLSFVSRAIAGAAALVLATAAPVAAQPAEQFFQGKTIRIIVALGTGGDYDAYARLASRWLSKHIPRSPSIVVQNMPGAGGIVAANHVFNVAPKDGTVIGALHANTALAQVIGTANVEYDARQFSWIGRTSSGGLDVHHTWHTTGVKSFNELLTREVVVGGGGPTSASVVLPTAVNSLMGGKLKILGGYKGTAETTLALERGEIDMALQNWENLRRNSVDWLRDKKINLIVQYGLQRHPELPDVPSIMELAKNEEQRQVWTLLLRPSTIGYSLALPPGVPADRVALLRKAFTDMANDPGMRAEAEKINLPVEPVSGETLEQSVHSLFKIDPKAVDQAKALLQR
jgi:tripartite-type tricarboxylate transporter receptor subunit TctC